MSGSTEPLQFAYQKDRGVYEAVLTLLHNVHMHVEKPANFARLVFIVFSSAFNTMQPHLLGHKLQKLGVSPHLIAWVLSSQTDGSW